MVLTPSQPPPPAPATAPPAFGPTVRLLGGLVRLSWRSTMGLLALLAVLICLMTAVVLVGFWAVLWALQKDLVLGSGTVPFWPKWVPTVQLLQQYSWGYLVAAGVALLVVLPCALAILERLWFVGYRRPGSAR